MTKNNIITCFTLLYCTICHAQVEKIDTDRPDQTESANTVPRNYLQAEFGFNKENRRKKNYDLLHPTALFRYGLTNFEFRLEATVRSTYDQLIPDPKWTTGFDPVKFGFKSVLWEEKNWLPKTTLIAGVGLPGIASTKFKANHLAPFFSFSMQNSLTKTISLGYNIGAEWDGISITPSWIYTFAPGFNLGEKWYTYLEIFGAVTKNEKPQHNLDTGWCYYINDNIKLDISGGIGISSEAPKSYIAIGGSVRFNTHSKK